MEGRYCDRDRAPVGARRFVCSVPRLAQERVRGDRLLTERALGIESGKALATTSMSRFGEASTIDKQRISAGQEALGILGTTARGVLARHLAQLTLDNLPFSSAKQRLTRCCSLTLYRNAFQAH